MATVKRFEDLEAWQTAREIVNTIYQASSNEYFASDFSLRDQVRRGAVSIMANIAEGFSRRSNREFAQFLFTAKASAAEVQSHLYVALDQGYLTQDQFSALYERLDHCSRQISKLISYLRFSNQ